jgi:hypothetical protein
MSPVSRKDCFFLFLALMCGAFMMASCGDSIAAGNLIGEWGGAHIRLVVKDTSAALEFDCAFGEVDGPIDPDKDGNFEVRGVYASERGGPRRMGEPPPKRQPAIYRGWTDGKEMRLTVILVDTGREVGSFSLGLGRRASLDKCL